MTFLDTALPPTVSVGLCRRLQPSSNYKALSAVFLAILFLASTSHAMSVVKQVAVIGATGRVGRAAVQQLVAKGIKCKILVRSSSSSSLPAAPTQLADCTSSAEVATYLASLQGVSVVPGDVGNTAALQSLVQDCDACLALYGATRKSKISDLWNSNVADEDPTHSKQVNYQGVVNLIQACAASDKCKRIVRITGKGETPTSFISILINLLGSMAKAWNYQGEQALRKQTDVAYTIIRPGVMAEEPSVTQESSSSSSSSEIGLALADNGGDLPVSKIPYVDVASLCVECLEYDNAARTTLCAMTTASDGAKSWEPLLAKVQADRRSFPEDMLEQHYAAVRKTLFGVGAFCVAVLALLLKWIL